MDFMKKQKDENMTDSHAFSPQAQQSVQTIEMHQQEASLHRTARRMMAALPTAGVGCRRNLPFGLNKP
jgi:hypothetical protein